LPGRRHAIWIIAVAAAALLAVLVVQHSMHDPSGRTFRIGFQESLPDQSIGPGGTPVGPAVEVVREAGRRRNIHLQWVFMPAGPESAMSSGAVDLWPILGELPERAGRFFISRPWATQRFWLVVDAKSNIRSMGQIAGKNLALRFPGTAESVAHKSLPGVHILRRNSVAESTSAVCAGEVGAALVSERAGRSVVVDLPQVCEGKTFRYISMGNTIVHFGVGASLRNPNAKWAAEAIRDELSNLSDEGATLFRRQGSEKVAPAGQL